LAIAKLPEITRGFVLALRRWLVDTNYHRGCTWKWRMPGSRTMPLSP